MTTIFTWSPLDPADVERTFAERFEPVTTTVKARGLFESHELADGATILRLSFQRDWVYAHIIKDGQPRTRRYRHDQDVRITQWVRRDGSK